MKKVLLSALMLAGFALNGQVLVSEDFNTLTPGNLGTDVTGATAGQNSWFTLNGANTDYQITTIDAAHGQSLTIAGYNSYDATPNSTLNSRLAAKFGTATPTVGNNIVHGKFDLYTGAPGSNSQIQMRVWGADGTASRTLGGFLYNTATGVLTGLATVNNTGTGTPGPTTYSWGLAAAPGVILQPNTWYTLSFHYNRTTGAVTFFFPGGSGSVSGGTTYTLIPGMMAEDVYLYNIASTGNMVSKTAGFDNILVEFSNAANLSTTEFPTKNAELSLYPNPVADILNIKTKEKVQSASVFDMSGRKIEARVMDNAVDVTNLEKGTYIINIQTANGTTSEKFIKK